ncbi:MAG: aldo/keto reductase [Clostridia bacterium]|nr:aldo/keto reductase [Clostridia bacterium]
MEYRELGRTGLRISRIGFGGIPIQRVEEADCAPLFDALESAGINYIDTARGYTVSEARIGAALQGRREKFILATKSMARTAEAMAADVEESLRCLRTDHIDLYQIHNPNLAQLEEVCAPGGALEALLAAKAAGKIGHIGVTLHSVEAFRAALDKGCFETVMFPYNIVERQGAALIDECREKGVGFICMKPLAGGAIEKGSLALRFILQNDSVDCIIPGMATEAEVAENAAVTGEPLTGAEQAEVSRIAGELGTHFCRRCGYCAPCTAGINISGAFLFHGYLTRYGLEDWARSRYAAMGTTASVCVDCGACESRCPYNLPIREMLRECAAAFGK